VLCPSRRLSLRLALLNKLSLPSPKLCYMLYDLSQLLCNTLFTDIALTQILVWAVGRVVVLLYEVVDH